MGLLRVELCPTILFRLVLAVTVLLICAVCFVTGLCYCGIAVMVCVGWKGGVCCLRAAITIWWCVSCLVLSCLVLFSLLFVGVRGSARAALRARTLSPNTIAFPVVFSCLLPCSVCSFLSLFLCWNGGG
nr:MAG TPA: hypothetical protein [Caudoviricetes sp.]